MPEHYLVRALIGGQNCEVEAHPEMFLASWGASEDSEATKRRQGEVEGPVAVLRSTGAPELGAPPHTECPSPAAVALEELPTARHGSWVLIHVSEGPWGARCYGRCRTQGQTVKKAVTDPTEWTQMGKLTRFSRVGMSGSSSNHAMGRVLWRPVQGKELFGRWSVDGRQVYQCETGQIAFHFVRRRRDDRNEATFWGIKAGVDENVKCSERSALMK